MSDLDTPGSSRRCEALSRPIVFISNRAGAAEWQLYTMASDGGDPKNLGHGHFRNPAWSSDGQSIAFREHDIADYYQTSFTTELGIMAYDGSERVNLLVEDSGEAARLGIYRSFDGPSWSADGLELAFASKRSGSFRAWGISRWGGELRSLLPDFAEPHAWPSWSPLADSTELALVTLGDTRDIWIANTQASELAQNLTGGAFPNPEAPRWSPDGTRLAFSAERVAGVEASREIYVATLATSSFTQVTDDEGADYQPVWSPDGASLLISSQRERLNLSGRSSGTDSIGLWIVPLAAPDAARALTSGSGGHAIGDWLWNDDCTAEL